MIQCQDVLLVCDSCKGEFIGVCISVKRYCLCRNQYPDIPLVYESFNQCQDILLVCESVFRCVVDVKMCC